ncbi:hypothetical protein PMIN02_008527 [Paraphaeosphaeria minitans]|uniref:Heme haloperoxidase family profile domain-containing protein n=1 Tax=Paraphaeosphaeria minitans TaxID=565426 RepID=A0A9P6G8R5_9PLEO|nr:hypothetical protein PMIN01_10950 [Paraphaeosphaeria minitans]
MKIAVWTACLLSSVAAYPSVQEHQSNDYPWRAPKATDRRSPCPMLNTLANHGYLPRNGANISMEILIAGLKTSVNLGADATEVVGAAALKGSTTGNASTFHLTDLDKHGLIEHDGSLSRADIYFGDNHSFNATIWAQTASHFTSPIISLATAAKAHKARLAAAQIENPQFNMSASDVQASMIETALYLSVLSNDTGATAVSAWVQKVFTEEKLPIKEGWKRPEGEISVSTLTALVGKLVAEGM